MKRNISLIVLTLEIAAIVILHAVKMSQAQDIRANIAKTTILTPAGKQALLLSIK